MFLRTSIIFGRKRIRSSSHRILDIYQSVDPNGRINISLSILCPTQSEIRKFHSSKFKNNVDTTVDAHTAPFLPPSSSSSLSPSITNQFVVPVRIGPSLKKYGQNLTQAASDGKLDPVIGRDKEIERTLQVLSEPGVGKTAIAEGLALRIVKGDVPTSIKNCVIISLDLASMLAGAKFRGDFEERLKGVLKDVEAAGDRIIIFIDEIHILAGAGASEGAIDAANMLKPQLARGQLRCLGATTTEEYTKYIEKDGALARRFQAIKVEEPTVESTIKFLSGLRSKYELHHGVQISDEALSSAAKLSHRYITSRRLPDKAIDLIDEGASRLRLEHERQPVRVQEIETQIVETRRRIAATKAKAYGSHDKENTTESTYYDGTAEAELRTLEKEISTLTVERSGLLEKFVSLHDTINTINEARKKIDSLKTELFSFERQENYERAGMINIEIDKAIQLKESLESSLPVSNVVKSSHIADIVASVTGIPVGSLVDGERISLLSMENQLSKEVIGQDEAISVISKCIRLSRAGLRYHDRPLGCFLLLGQTGVGKTEIAKVLAKFLFQDQSAMFRIDMSEYMERFAVSRLIGSPPGYVGYEEGGILTEAVRRKPYQLILLDEFEKAHREVSNILLQVFDEGRLTDSHGRVVDFRNTVILMTSNLGQSAIFDKNKKQREKEMGDGDNADDKGGEVSNKSLSMSIVNSYFAPEFVNRLDDIIVMNPLGREAIAKICQVQLAKVSSLLAERGISASISKECEEWLSSTGYSAEHGARPLKRLIQSSIMQPLSHLILENKVGMGTHVDITMETQELTTDNANANATRQPSFSFSNKLARIHQKKNKVLSK